MSTKVSKKSLANKSESEKVSAKMKIAQKARNDDFTLIVRGTRDYNVDVTATAQFVTVDNDIDSYSIYQTASVVTQKVTSIVIECDNDMKIESIEIAKDSVKFVCDKIEYTATRSIDTVEYNKRLKARGDSAYDDFTRSDLNSIVSDALANYHSAFEKNKRGASVARVAQSLVLSEFENEIVSLMKQMNASQDDIDAKLREIRENARNQALLKAAEKRKQAKLNADKNAVDADSIESVTAQDVRDVVPARDSK